MRVGFTGGTSVQECLMKVNSLVGEEKKEVRFSSWNAVEVHNVTLVYGDDCTPLTHR